MGMKIWVALVISGAYDQFGKRTYDERDGVDVVDDIVRYAVQLETRFSSAS